MSNLVQIMAYAVENKQTYRIRFCKWLSKNRQKYKREIDIMGEKVNSEIDRSKIIEEYYLSDIMYSPKKYIYLDGIVL